MSAPLLGADVAFASGAVCAGCGGPVTIKDDVLEQADGSIKAVTSSCPKCEWSRTVRNDAVTLPGAPAAG